MAAFLRVTTESSFVSESLGKDNSALVTSTRHQGGFHGRGNFPPTNWSCGGRGFNNRGRGGNSNRGLGFGSGQGRIGFLHCTHCGGDNHTVDRCYDLYGKI